MKPYVTFDKIELLDNEADFNWAHLTYYFRSKDTGSDCIIEVKIQVPKEHQTIEAIKLFAISSAKVYLEQSKNSEWIDSRFNIPKD
jgi:hypothetical protein